MLIPKHDNEGIHTLEAENDKRAADLVRYTGLLLQKTYPRYVWGVRYEGEFPFGIICLNLAELINFGLENAMVINPKDWGTIYEYDAIVKRLGGELLERASLSRNGSQNIDVKVRPDGFHPKFDRTLKETKIILK